MDNTKPPEMEPEMENEETFDLSDPDKAVEYWTSQISTHDENMLNVYYYRRAEAYMAKSRHDKKFLQSALDDINTSLCIAGDNAEEYSLRAKIYEELGNYEKAQWNYFKAKHTNAFLNVINEQDNTGSKKDLSGRQFISIINKISVMKISGKIILSLPAQDNEPLEPEILYSGGENALFRRRPDQFIILEKVPDDFFSDAGVRDAVFNKKEIFIEEDDENPALAAPLQPDEAPLQGRQYRTDVRLVIEKLDSAESIIKDGYPVFTSLRAQVSANLDKPIKDVIGKEDFVNLAAVLAREENYTLLDKYTAEGLPLNEKTGFIFKVWRPTPLFYITTNRLVGFMHDPLKMIRYLAANGANPDMACEEDDTPLGNQCLENGLPVIMKTLLEAGADPNCFTEIDSGPIKPLHLLLLPCEYDEETETLLPVKAANIEKIRLLIDKGADVNYVNDSGSTALSIAINNCEGDVRKEIVKLLLEKGADIKSAIDGLIKGIEYKHSKSAFSLYEIYSGNIDCLPVKQDAGLAHKYLCIADDLMNKSF